MALQKLNIPLERIFQISKRLEIKPIIDLPSVSSQSCYSIVI